MALLLSQDQAALQPYCATGLAPTEKGQLVLLLCLASTLVATSLEGLVASLLCLGKGQVASWRRRHSWQRTW